jgi:hypothetical protein
MRQGTRVTTRLIQGEQPWAGQNLLWNRRSDTGIVVQRWTANEREAYEVQHDDGSYSVYWRDELEETD